ncbi:NAD(P)-binding protein [Bradyrhizobium septentrionale]|uniref:NAD(P)-binding protein n=1 Tax=Bradyrhizobium septentrionale TaxID=1404411 RepID=A0ABZ2P573_9BRAD
MTSRIAIVGSGPSGFFAAEALLKSNLRLQVHMFDRLPTPFGLVRSGVAPDHASIKGVSRVFDRIAEDSAFEFCGNIEIGKDISLNELRRTYSAVVLAHGAAADSKLGIPGECLPQVFSAGQFVGWYNGHPDFSDLRPDFNTENAVIFGHGNVAIDIARMLLGDPQKFRKTDIAEHALDSLRGSKIKTVHLVGRRGPLQASFTTAELRELLLKMEDMRVEIDAAALHLSSSEADELSKPANAVAKRNIDLMREVADNSHQAAASKLLLISFFESPLEIRGSTKVEAVSLARNVIVNTPQGKRAIPTDERREISAGLVLTSIGFRGRALPGAPFDRLTGRIPNQNGRVQLGDGSTAPLYAVGWIKRGANGVIGTNRADAAETVACMLSDYTERKWLEPDLVNRGKHALPPKSTSFHDWQLINQAEISAGLAVERPRVKFTTIADMLDVLPQRQAR